MVLSSLFKNCVVFSHEVCLRFFFVFLDVLALSEFSSRLFCLVLSINGPLKVV